MQAKAIGRDCRVALVHDGLAINQRKSAKRRHSLVEAVTRERRDEWFAESLTSLGEQEQRNGLRSQQRSVDDQRLGTGMQLGSLLYGEGKRLRYGHAIVVFSGCTGGVIEQ